MLNSTCIIIDAPTCMYNCTPDLMYSFMVLVFDYFIVLWFQGPLMVHVTKLYPNHDAAVFQALGRVLSGTCKH